MKIRVISDLHLEIARKKFKFIPCDVIILAGDIVSGRKRNLLPWLIKSLRQDTNIPVLYVMGNHEYYGGVIPFVVSQTKALLAQYKIDNVHILDNNICEINGINFIGSTLWSNFSMIERMNISLNNFCEWIEYEINDFRTILYSPNVTLAAKDIINFNMKARDFIKDNTHKTSVVITHFCPSEKSIHSKYANDPINPYYVNSCEDLMTSNIPLWIHGHTHTSFDYQINSTRIICNPRGYKDENSSFDPNLIIEL